MAYTTIDDPSAHFQNVLWTGNGTAGNAVTFDGNSDMQPDFVWSKKRDGATSHVLKDTSRGGTSNNDLHLVSNSTAAESTYANYRMDFDSDGFTLDGVGDTGFQGSGTSMVSWSWKANGGTTSTNNDGSITTTTQVNSDAGFSIVTWAGGGTGSLGHGLGEVPDMWIVKNRDYAVSWAIGFSDSSILGGTSNYLMLNSSSAIATYNNIWGSSPANSNTITMAGDRSVNISGDDYVAYFFKAKQGYSKFGKYTGNGNANGPFVYTGFKPAFIMLKRTNGGDGWFLLDAKRNPTNISTNSAIRGDESGAEGSASKLLDMLSNGFKLRGADGAYNGGDNPYIFMAFAENPFVTSTGIPTTAF